MVRTLGRLLVAGALAFFAAAPAARAEFDIQITSAVTGTIDINVNDATLNTSGRTDTISVNTSALNAALAGTGFSFTNLGANIIPSNGNAVLTVTANVVSSGFTGPITVAVSAMDYSLPGSPFGSTLTSTEGHSFTGGFGGASFNSYFDSSNTEFTTTGPTVTNPSPLVFGSSTATSSVSLTNSTGVNVISPFALTNVTTLTLSATGAQDLFTGVTTVTARAVPEPGSMALVLLGGTALVARLRRRKVEA